MARSTRTPAAPDVRTSQDGAGQPAGVRPAGQLAGNQAMPPPPRLRRRPALTAIGVLIIAIGGLVAAWLVSSLNDTEDVLAARTTIDRGSIIDDGDLVAVSINADPGLAVVPATRRESLVGLRATVDIAEGTLLTPGSTADGLVPAAGESLVGVTLTVGQLPSQPLRSGDTVRIVETPRNQDDPPTEVPAAIDAVVVAVQELPDSGEVIVDVSVPSAEAAGLAARSATGRVAMVLDSSER